MKLLKSTCSQVPVISVVTVARICNWVSGGVFLTCYRGASAGGKYQSGVKASRVVNWKQVDVAASRSFWLSWNALIARGTRCRGCTVATVSQSTMPRALDCPCCPGKSVACEWGRGCTGERWLCG